MLEKLTKRIVYQAVTGTLRIPHPANTMVGRSVEDPDFGGRTDSHRSPTERAEEILAKMTLEEKVRFSGGYQQLGIHPFPRLGLPSIWCSDATSGLRCFPGGTAFLAAIGMAASWDTDLIEELSVAIAEEFRAVGVSILLGPGVNIYRVPTCGRNFEYMGEDPYLAGKICAAYIRGAQSRGVLTTVKHFAANNSEYDRHKTDSVMDERTLREIYLPAFRMAVQEGGSWGVMSAYNPVNGVYASENEFLLKKILREEWGFKGFVISDWASLYSTVPVIKNGLNLEMPEGKWVNLKKVSQAIRNGEIVEEDIDRMVLPLLASLFKAGVYDRPQIDPSASLYSPAHISLAKKAAGSAIVLLKNDGSLLPLDKEKIKRIIVIGRTSVATPTGGGGSSYVHRDNRINLLDGIRQEFGDCLVTHIPFRKMKISRQQAGLIRAADVVILGAGYFTHEESESYERPWELPEHQGRFIRQVSKLNPNIVVVLSAGGGVETQSWIDFVPALIHNFYLGEFTGEITARAISGNINPSGKLPFTMAKSWNDFAATQNYVKNYHKAGLKRVFVGQGNPNLRKVRKMDYKEGLNIGYRHFDTARIEPQFAFGHGLSYTKFALTAAEISIIDGLPEVNISITNTGLRSGSEVLQCYVRDLESSLYRPEKELKAFMKISLEPGESKMLTFRLEIEAFQFFNDLIGKWVAEPGKFEVLIGNSSRNIFSTFEFNL